MQYKVVKQRGGGRDYSENYWQVFVCRIIEKPRETIKMQFDFVLRHGNN